MSVYATESYFTGESCRLRRYSLRLDGFVSLYAPLNGGEMLTRPLIFSGKSLELNYSTSAGGSMYVELQDESGSAIPGFSRADCDIIYGDQLNRTVTWGGNGDVSRLSGTPVIIRFIMADTDLYNFRFSGN
jgi:hypothetical protein